MKKIISLICAAAMLFSMASLTACGDSAASDDATTQAQTQQTTVSETEETEPADTATTAETEETEPADTATAPQEGEEPEQTATSLAVYFSATGNTQGIAEMIAELTGAELYEIQPQEPYTDEDLDYGNSESRTSIEADDPSTRPQIAEELPDLSGVTTLYIGYPIWHGQAPKILYTFVEGCDLDGITIVPFCTSASSGIGSSAENLAEAAGAGTWLDGERFSASASEDEVVQRLEELGLN